MRQALYILCVATIAASTFGTSGCGSSSVPAVKRLPGKWHGEMIVYEDAVQGKLPPEKIEEMAKMQMDFEFRPDGSMVLSGANSGKAFATEGRWEKIKEDGDLLTIKSTEQSGTQKDINIEFEGSDIFYIPLRGQISPQAEVADLGAMRFTRLR